MLKFRAPCSGITFGGAHGSICDAEELTMASCVKDKNPADCTIEAIIYGYHLPYPNPPHQIFFYYDGETGRI